MTVPNKCADDFSKIVITDVYIFDHATQDTIEIGDITLASKTPAMARFLTDVGDALRTTGKDAKIHFRGCNVGAGDGVFLQELATGTGHTVTGGVGGSMLGISIRFTDITWYIPDIGPDYHFTAIYQASPGGVPPTTLWKDELVTVASGFGGGFYNPWGPQPY